MSYDNERSGDGMYASRESMRRRKSEYDRLPEQTRLKLDELTSVVQNAPFVPFNKTLIKMEKDQLIELIESIRQVLPAELQYAHRVIRRRDKILEEAEDERRSIITTAQHEAERMIDEHQIVTMAQYRADEIIREAQRNAQQLERDTQYELDNMRMQTLIYSKNMFGALDEYVKDLNAEFGERFAECMKMLEVSMNGIETCREQVDQDINELDGIMKAEVKVDDRYEDSAFTDSAFAEEYENVQAQYSAGEDVIEYEDVPNAAQDERYEEPMQETGYYSEEDPDGVFAEEN